VVINHHSTARTDKGWPCKKWNRCCNREKGLNPDRKKEEEEKAEKEDDKKRNVA